MFRFGFPGEILSCPQAVHDRYDTLSCAWKIEQTTTIIRDRQCLQCEREQEEREQAAKVSQNRERQEAELEEWEQALFEQYGPANVEDLEAKALFNSSQHWGKFLHIGELAEEFHANNISLNV